MSTDETFQESLSTASSQTDVRRSAFEWWGNLTLESQFYVTIEHNNLIAGDNTRHPNTLTGSEIEKLYKAVHFA